MCVWNVGVWCAVVWVWVSVSRVVGVDGEWSFVNVFGVLCYEFRCVCVCVCSVFVCMIVWLRGVSLRCAVLVMFSCGVVVVWWRCVCVVCNVVGVVL